MQAMERTMEQSYTVRQVPQVIYFRMRRPKPEKLYTAEEFYAIPEETHSELINGRICEMVTPSLNHQTIALTIAMHASEFISKNGGQCRAFIAPASVEPFPGEAMVLEPDVFVVCDPDKLDNRSCKGAPDWVVEITSPSTSSRDYTTKLDVYLRAGVHEYWIVDPDKRRVQAYQLEADDSIMQEYSFSDAVPVHTLPGLAIDFAQMELL